MPPNQPHELEKIPGIGPKRAQAFREAGFEKVEDLQDATEEELVAVEMIDEVLARDIKTTIMPDNDDGNGSSSPMNDVDGSAFESQSRAIRKQIKGATGPLVDLVDEREHLQRILEPFQNGDADGVRSVLEELGLRQNCRPLCRVVCSWECSRICFQLCPEPPQVEFSTEELTELSEGLGRLRKQEQIQELVQVVEEEDSETFHGILEEAGLERFCHVICQWICRVRCRVLCEQICRPEADRERAVSQLRTTARALSQLGSSPESLSQAMEAIQNVDRKAFRSALEQTELMEFCRLLCDFLCWWDCFPRCRRLCPEPPSIDFSVDELQQLGLGMCSLARSEPLLDRYIESVESKESEEFQEVLTSLQLAPFCHVLCWWTCAIRCRLVCREVCEPETVCELDEPTGCTEEEPSEQPAGTVVRVTGTASGADFDHYTLQWRRVQGAECTDDAGWHDDQIIYPGGGSTGTSPVRGDTLGWLMTTHLPADSYEIRLCVFTEDEQQSSCCCIQFRLFKSTVWIDGVADAPVQTPPGPFDPAAPVVDPPGSGGQVVPVGGNVSVTGNAFVGDCEGRQVECFDVLYRPGHHPKPSDCDPSDYVGSLLAAHDAPLCFTGDSTCSETEKRARESNITGPGAPLTVHWQRVKVELPWGGTTEVCKLEPFRFSSHRQLPGCPDAKHLCQSGPYTLLLHVRDTAGNVYCDTQQVWFDNKPMRSDVHVAFEGIRELPACTDLNLAEFVPDRHSCGSAWNVDLLGVAFDEYIDPSDHTYPSDNFDHYKLQVTRQGGPTLNIPIATSPGAYGPNPLQGTNRVGQPGVRCHDNLPSRCDPLKPSYPPRSPGVLSLLDLRVFDAQCAPQVPSPYDIPEGFPLNRGEACGYAFEVYGQDQTWSDGRHGGLHRAWSSPWAVTVVNDL